jgi:DNA invertase Pin-like site-specific DNA recombinase
MRRIGYARVSSYGQSLDVQLEKLKDCDRVFQEKQSARSTESRHQLALCLDHVQDGDVLVITKLDRLARSTRDLLNILNQLDQKRVKLHALDQQIDTSTPAGMLLVTMLGAIAAFENDLRKERQADGIALAKRRGVLFGRRRTLTEGQVLRLRELRAEGITIAELMREYNVSRASIYRALRC